jgi:hypothetical protein
VVLLAGGSLSCVRYARYRGLSAGTGTCEGACGHYVECKEDRAPRALQTCMAECREIYVYDGVADEESLMAFESLDCTATVGFVDGNGGAGERATGSRRADGERSKKP